MNSKYILPAIIGGSILGLFLIGLMTAFTAQNGAIKREAAIESSGLDINTEESRRVSLFNNLVDSIESYNSHEEKIMIAVADARKKSASGDIEEAKLVVNAVAENYPELKSQDNYKQAMEEFSITENRIASTIKSYNKQIKSYEAYCRTQPRSMFLNMMGYMQEDFEPKVVPVVADAHMNLFKK